MISLILDAPENVAAFQAMGEITKEDFDLVVTPEVKKKIEKFSELNYLMLLDTDINHFTAGAWFEDVLLGLKNLTQWNRAAIVTDSNGIQNFTEIFSGLMPGGFKAFPKENLYNALYWCHNGNEVDK